MYGARLGSTVPEDYTFRTLSRKRFRCVQTGDIVKASRSKTYRWMKAKQARVPPPPLRPVLPTLKMGRLQYSTCTSCFGMVWHFRRPGEYVCDWCKKRYLVEAAWA